LRGGSTQRGLTRRWKTQLLEPMAESGVWDAHEETGVNPPGLVWVDGFIDTSNSKLDIHTMDKGRCMLKTNGFEVPGFFISVPMRQLS